MNYRGPGRYQHYKGGVYDVLGLALQEDTVTKPPDEYGLGQIGEGHDEVTFVIYRPLSPGSMLEQRRETFWARELEDFNAQVPLPDRPGDQPRFQKLSEWRDPGVREPALQVDPLDRLHAQGGSCPAAVPVRGATDAASGCICGVMLNDSRRADTILEGAPIGVWIAAAENPSTLVKWCFGDGLPQVDPDAHGYVANYTTCPVWLAEWETRHIAEERVGGVFEDAEQEATFDLVDALMSGDVEAGEIPGWEEDPVEALSPRDQARLLLRSGATGR